MQQPKLRDGYRKLETHPLNQIPAVFIKGICRQLVFHLATGGRDISGDDWSRIFANQIQAENQNRPIGLVDVTWQNCCWSLKTVKNKNPWNVESVRLIVGRTSPAYSYGITDAKSDIQTTGNSVLAIYNQRIDQVRSEYQDTRLGVLIRIMANLEFAYFERVLAPFPINDFSWQSNENGNLLGYRDGQHVFTRQPHGSQLTMMERVPSSSTRFKISQSPAEIDIESVLEQVGYSDEWVQTN